MNNTELLAAYIAVHKDWAETRRREQMLFAALQRRGLIDPLTGRPRAEAMADALADEYNEVEEIKSRESPFDLYIFSDGVIVQRPRVLHEGNGWVEGVTRSPQLQTLYLSEPVSVRPPVRTWGRVLSEPPELNGVRIYMETTTKKGVWG